MKFEAIECLFNFGGFGESEGQMKTPMGVAVNAQNDIIVADTCNSRIQVFDKEGKFKSQFRDGGRTEGDSRATLYPHRVAVARASKNIIVIERTLIPQILIFMPCGQFVRKYGANTLTSPQAVTVDNKGRIIVVEDEVNRVVIFDQLFSVLHRFDCHDLLKSPTGVVANDKQEIFISDYDYCCVTVFNYEGQHIRLIGANRINNPPFNVGLTTEGMILMAGQQAQNLKLTLYTQDGVLVTAYRSNEKHPRGYGVALMDDNTVVVSSDDHRIYVYRYLPAPQV